MTLVKNFCSEVKPDDLNPHSVSEGLGILQRTRSLGRKRVAVPLDSPFRTPLKKHYHRVSSMKSENSAIEALPQDILIRIVCGVDHDDLKQLFHVSKVISEATLIAKQSHFAFSTPSKTKVPRQSSNDTIQSENEGAPPDAPRRPRKSRIIEKKLADITVALFASPKKKRRSRNQRFK